MKTCDFVERRCLADALPNPYCKLANEPRKIINFWVFANTVYVGVLEVNIFMLYYLSVYGYIFSYMLGLYLLSKYLAKNIAYPLGGNIMLRELETSIAQEKKRRIVFALEKHRAYLLNKYPSADDTRLCRHVRQSILLPFVATLETISQVEPRDDVVLKTLEAFKNLLNMKKGNDELEIIKSLLSSELCSNLLLNDDPSEIDNVIELLHQVESIPTQFQADKFSEQNHDLLDIYPKENDDKEDKKDAELVDIHPPKDFLVSVSSLAKQIYQKRAKAAVELRTPLNLRFFEYELAATFRMKKLTFETEPNVFVNGAFFQASNPRNTCIMMNPNAAIYQFALHQNFWLRFYLSHDCNVILFNYRGYAGSTGSASPENCITDGVFVFEALTAELDKIVGSDKTDFFFANKDHANHQPGNIGFIMHAESIGGVVAAALFERYRDEIKLVVFARNFSSLSTTASFLLNPVLGWIVKNIVRWEADNVRSVLEVTGLHRKLEFQDVESRPNTPRCVILCDPNDEIIKHPASLKIGLASQVFSYAIGPQTSTRSSYLPCFKETSTPILDPSLGIIYSLLVDATFSHTLAKAYYELRGALRQITQTNKTPTMRLFVQAFNVLSSLDSCGQMFQQAMSEFLRSTGRETSVQKFMDSEIQNSTDNPLLNWFKVALTFCKQNDVFKRQIEDVVSVFSTPPTNMVDFGLKLPISKILEAVKALGQALDNGVGQSQVTVVPLTCGHNGDLSKGEINLYLKAVGDML